MVNWSDAGGIAAIVSALYLPFILSPAAYSVLHVFFRWLVQFLWPEASYCLCLPWEDVPDGKLHDCRSSAGPYFRTDCYCSPEHLSLVFSRAFSVITRQKSLIKKPRSLSLRHTYVYTDVFTLLAFILCSTNEEPSCTAIQLKERDNVLIARVHMRARHYGRPERIRNEMTKKTLEGILQGYPPWYREFLVVSHGPVVPHPLQSRDDIVRAGWVVAVGLSTTSPLPRTLHTRRDFMDKPIKRVLQKLRDSLKPHFPDNSILDDAIQGVQDLIEKRTDSGARVFLDYSSSKIADLAGSDCSFAMSIFNKVGPLTGDEAARLAPILEPVVVVAYRGAESVVAHCKNGLEPFQIPSRLQDFRQPLFVDLGRTV